MDILVMGGTQFNGLAVVHELVRQGHNVTILNRGQTEAPLPDGLNRLYGDRTDTAQMHEVLGGLTFDVLYDLGAYHQGDAELMFDIFNGNIGHYVCASSTVIYSASELSPMRETSPLESGSSQIEYGRGKIDCENYLWERVAQDKFPATIVPFSMVFGPRNIIPDREQRMMHRLLAGRPILIPGDGTTMVQVTHVDDQARALVAMAGKQDSVGERYNVCAPTYVTDVGYVATMAEVLGVDADMRFVPHDVMEALWDGELSLDLGEATGAKIDIRTSDAARKKQAGQNLRMKFKLATLVQRLAPNIHRWNRSTLFSSQKITDLTGWQAEHDFPSMVQHVWDWYQSEDLQTTQTFDFTFEDQLIDYVGRS